MKNVGKKKEALSIMMDQMEKDLEEKRAKGDGQALQRQVELARFREMMSSKCQHEWHMSGEDGHLYCSKCGEDGGSPWDC